MSATTYVVNLFIPIGAMALDISLKVFSNMFYPSQNQIHVELEAKEIQRLKKSKNRVNSNGNGEVEIHI